MTRYEIVEHMNASDAWRRVRDREPNLGMGPGGPEEMIAKIQDELQRGTPFSYAEDDRG